MPAILPTTSRPLSCLTLARETGAVLSSFTVNTSTNASNVMSAPASTAWIRAGLAAAELGISRVRLRTAAPGLGIRTRELEGSHGTLYHSGDLAAAVARLDQEAAARIAEARAPKQQKTAERNGRSGMKTARTATQ